MADAAQVLSRLEAHPAFGLQGPFIAQAKVLAKQSKQASQPSAFASARYDVWLREAVTGMSWNGFPLPGARRPCHPAYAEAGDARTLDPDAYKKLCCSTKETKEVVTQYHTIYGLPGWCTDAYLKWDGAAQGDIKDRGRGQG